MILDVKKLYNSLVKEGETIVHYEGIYSDNIIDNILDKVDNNKHLSKKNRRKLFFVSVELLQNIHHHALEIPLNNKKQKYFYFLINKINDTTFKINAGNFVDKKVFNKLKSTIQMLNKLNLEETRQLYKTVLTNNQFSEKGGGGLGIIDMKKRTEQNLEYKQVFIKKNLYFFNFSILLLNKI